MFLPGLEPSGGTYAMREACRVCGSRVGYLRPKSGQNCVFCECGAHVYNAPREETEGRDRVERVERKAATEAERRLEALLSRCESPIERTLARELVRVSRSVVAQHDVTVDGCAYRLDFAIPRLLVAVECDGHTFHERTPEQATYDRRRDRALQSAGWLVLRFTASEIEADAAARADEVARACFARLEERKR